MDEIALLNRARPEPAPPTTEEWAVMRDAVMAHVTDPDLVRPDHGTRPPSRRGRVLVAVAAAVLVVTVVVAAVAGRGTDEGTGPPATSPGPPPTTSAAAAAPLPTVVQMQVHAESTGGAAGDSTRDGTILVHRVERGLTIADLAGCAPCVDATFLVSPGLSAMADDTEAGVDAAFADLAPDGIGSGSRLRALATILTNPVGPIARARALELLRAEPAAVGLDVTTARGDVGDRYTVTAPDGDHSVVVDDDGFVLETVTRFGPEPQAGTTTLPGTPPPEVPDLDTARVVTSIGLFGTDEAIAITTTYTRPVADADPPPAVLALAEVARRQSGCTSASGRDGPVSGADGVELPIPADLAYVHCP